MNLRGHLWTIMPTMRGWLQTPQTGAPWQGSVKDDHFGSIVLRGRFHSQNTVRDDSYRKSLVVLIHGLGGSADSTYVRNAASDALDHGYSVLRLSLRGADGSGQDIYNAGLTADLHAALMHPEFDEYDTIVVIGFSLGGHIALRAAVEGLDSRVRSVVAIGSPVDLSPGAKALDHRSRTLYREYILRELRAMYARMADQGRNHTPLSRIQSVRSLREFDALTIVPRYGFHDVEDYYAKSSVAPLLSELTIPALYVGSSLDPMIPRALVEPWLAKAGPNLTAIWVDDGGHVYFPQNLDLQLGQTTGIMRQALSWADRWSV